MAEAFVSPALLRWARERRRFTVSEAAEKLSVKLETFNAWENGEARPTLRQAQDLAQRLRVPLGLLFLSSPPTERFPLPDLRTVGDAPPSAPSPDLYDLLNDVLSKQQWYREYQEDEGAEPLPFVGRYTSNDDVNIIADDIRRTIGIDTVMRASIKNSEEFLREFIRRSETVGILVLRSGIVGNNTQRVLDVTEFRGFAISDDLAPLVFINGKDAKAAQIFTLGHEVAHLWLGETGVSNPDYRQPSSDQRNSTERVCNRIAAEVLAPKEDFLANWRDDRSISGNLDVLSNRYRVSRFVVLRQSLDLEKLDRPIYWEYYDRLTDAQVASTVSGSDSGGGNFYNNLLARNSTALTTRLMAAVAQGRTSYSEAARLLGVRLGTLETIANRLLVSSL